MFPSNIWWLDFGATTHISNTMRGFLSIQIINPNKNFVLMGNRVKAPVEAIGTYCLFLDTNKHIDLFQTFYVSSLSRNLVSLPKLDIDGYFIKFGNKSFTLFKNTSFVGSGILSDGLKKFNLHDEFAETLLTLHCSIGTKRGLINENSSNLWHKKLGHISRKRLERLVKDGILPNLDFTNLGMCVDCIKGKQTKHTKKGATRSTELIEIILTDICGPFNVPSFGKEKYFITFIDDFSRYSYIYLLHEKCQVVEALAVYITEVERQLERKMKIIRLDKGAEYYGKYDESGQCPCPFAKLLEKHGIYAQYTMPGTLV